MPFFILAVMFLRSVFKSRRQLLLENLALRQQVTMLRKSVKRPRATVADKLFWILFSRYVDGWRTALHGLHPDTVVRWHRQGFRFYWRWKSRGPKPGRPAMDGGLRKLIREMQARGSRQSIWAGERPESMVNYSSWVSKYHKRQFQNIWFVRKNHLRRPGELFLPTIQNVWRRLISLRFPLPDFECFMYSSCSAMIVGKLYISM